MWIDTYLGLSDVIKHEAGTHFMACEFQQNSAAIVIRLNSVPVESPLSMSTHERHHTLVCSAYNVICSESLSSDREVALQMAVKAVNDSVGPHGLIHSLLVFGTLSRLGLRTDSPTTSLYKRARDYEKK